LIGTILIGLLDSVFHHFFESQVQISSVGEHDGMFYLGSLVENAMGRLPVPQTNLGQ
jgi:methylaspartate ammonia-lyase